MTIALLSVKVVDRSEAPWLPAEESGRTFYRPVLYDPPEIRRGRDGEPYVLGGLHGMIDSEDFPTVWGFEDIDCPLQMVLAWNEAERRQREEAESEALCGSRTYREYRGENFHADG